MTDDRDVVLGRDEDILNTYRYLRLGMVVLVVLLATAVVWQIFFTGSKTCLQESISAYFYTPVRNVFVASLCAMGVCLIVYKGNTRTEDILLNFTGAAAFVVAFVPTEVDLSCEPSNVPSAGELAAAIRNNVWALLLAGIAVLILARIVNASQFRIGSWKPLEKFWLLLTIAVQLAAMLLFLVDRDLFVRKGHQAAAVSLFAGIVLVALANAISYARARNVESTGPAKYANRYALIAVTMLLTLAGLLAAHVAIDSWKQWLFWLEASVIVEFAIFWIVQTEELWNFVKRPEGADGQAGDRAVREGTRTPDPAR